MRKDIKNKTEEIINRYSCGESISQISKVFSCDNSVIKRILLKNNIPMKKFNSDNKFGRNNPMYGRKHTEESKNKISKSNLGKEAWNKGKKLILSDKNREIYSKNAKKNLSQYWCGKKNYKLSIRNKNNNPTKDPLVRKKMSQRRKELMKIGKITLSGVALIGDNNYSKVFGVWNKGLTKENNLSVLEISKKHKSFWKNPKFAEKKFKEFNIRPTKPENEIIEIITNNKLPFIYVGDGKFWIKGKNYSFNPDFINKDNKLILELFGDYWHNKEEAIKRDKERIETYSNRGYKTLIIWENELKNKSFVINKINNFLTI